MAFLAAIGAEALLSRRASEGISPRVVGLGCAEQDRLRNSQRTPQSSLRDTVDGPQGAVSMASPVGGSCR